MEGSLRPTGNQLPPAFWVFHTPGEEPSVAACPPAYMMFGFWGLKSMLVIRPTKLVFIMPGPIDTHLSLAMVSYMVVLAGTIACHPFTTNSTNCSEIGTSALIVRICSPG